MHGDRELLVVKQRVVTTICHGVSVSQVGAKPLLLVLSPTEAAVRGKYLLLSSTAVDADSRHRHRLCKIMSSICNWKCAGKQSLRCLQPMQHAADARVLTLHAGQLLNMNCFEGMCKVLQEGLTASRASPPFL